MSSTIEPGGTRGISGVGDWQTYRSRHSERVLGKRIKSNSEEKSVAVKSYATQTTLCWNHYKNVHIFPWTQRNWLQIDLLIFTHFMKIHKYKRTNKQTMAAEIQSHVVQMSLMQRLSNKTVENGLNLIQQHLTDHNKMEPEVFCPTRPNWIINDMSVVKRGGGKWSIRCRIDLLLLPSITVIVIMTNPETQTPLCCRARPRCSAPAC